MNAQPTEPSWLASLPLLDDAAIAALRDPELGGDPEFLVEVVEAFLDDTPPRLETLRMSLARGDAEAVGRAAHSLKGSSGNFGAMRMQTLCAEIDHRSRDGELESVPPLAAQLEVEYRLVADRLTELVAEAQGSWAAGSRQ